MTQRRPRGLGWLIGALTALASSAVASSARADTRPLEAAVKATYLYKLAPFISWPPAALAPDGPLVICVQGPREFEQMVDRATAGQRFGAHPIVVRRLARLDRGSGCHIAYVGGSAGQTPAEALAAVDGAPVLTVTDDDHGPAKGVVHLKLIGGRVRFSVDAGLASADGLAISSKLLALAAAVTR
jgi:hypothetical protein